MSNFWLKGFEIDDQLLCDMEKAKLALEQERINSQQFQQQRDYEFKCQLQEKQHEDELEKLEAQKALTQPRETIKDNYDSFHLKMCEIFLIFAQNKFKREPTIYVLEKIKIRKNNLYPN